MGDQWSAWCRSAIRAKHAARSGKSRQWRLLSDALRILSSADSQRSNPFRLRDKASNPNSHCAVAVPLFRSDQLQVLDFLFAYEVASVRAGCRQVIDVIGDSSRESGQTV